MRKHWLIGGLAGVFALAGLAFVQGAGGEFTFVDIAEKLCFLNAREGCSPSDAWSVALIF